MRGDRKELPPLDLLVAFEAAGRLSSFTAAAEQLNLTQAAVSRQIRLLEDELGQKLFIRSHRAVHLTEQGRKYLHTVTLALDHLANASRAVRRAPSGLGVTVAATHSVATLWLLPRIKNFQAENPDVDIKLIASDRDEECLADAVDISILRGDGSWPGFYAERLLDEEVFPICSPAYLAQSAPIARPADLIDTVLIHVEANHEEWMTWRVWLTEMQVELPESHRQLLINTYPLSIQAAVDGLGVALGWRHLVDDHLASGQLVRPLADSVTTKDGYFVLTRKGRDLPAEADAFLDWVRTTA